MSLPEQWIPGSKKREETAFFTVKFSLYVLCLVGASIF